VHARLEVCYGGGTDGSGAVPVLVIDALAMPDNRR
jgi:hypothetical protein